MSNAGPTIRLFPGRAGKAKSPTKGEIVARLASREKVTSTAVHNLLNALAEVCRDDLSRLGAVRLPKVGVLQTNTKSRKGPSPRSRADLEINLQGRLPTYAVKQQKKVGSKVRTKTKREPVLTAVAIHRILDHLAELTWNELGGTGTIRLPRIGTLSCRDSNLHFTPSTAFEVGSTTFNPSRGRRSST